MITTDVHPGKDLGTLELTISDEMVQHYIKGLDEPNPWYTTASPFGTKPSRTYFQKVRSAMGAPAFLARS